MKTKLAAALLTANLLLCNWSGISAQNTFSDDRIIEMINRFYTAYVTEISKMPEDGDKIELIKRKYCSAYLLKKLHRQGLDYDPFINAQDVEADLLKNLTIKKDMGSESLYIVSYPDNFSKTQILIKLKVIKDKDSYKIDDLS